MGSGTAKSTFQRRSKQEDLANMGDTYDTIINEEHKKNKMMLEQTWKSRQEKRGVSEMVVH